MGFHDHPETINRNGRPKKGECLTDILKAQGDLKDIETPSGKMARKEAVAMKLWKLALDGDVTALKYLYDRIDGRPKESIDLDSRGEVTYSIIKPGEREDD